MRKVIGFLLIASFAFFIVSLVARDLWVDDPSQVRTLGQAAIGQTIPQSGAANTVTAIVVQFRGLDTLGEVTVLFLSALGVALLSGEFAGRGLSELFADDGGFILHYGTRLVLPLIALVGAYIVAHGHLSPGGGFPGGVLIATAVFAVLMTNAQQRLSTRLMAVIEGLAGLAFVGLGTLGLLGDKFSFLANVLPKGQLGYLFSAGIIPLIYAAVGTKVAAELSTLVTSLTGSDRDGGEDHGASSIPADTQGGAR